MANLTPVPRFTAVGRHKACHVAAGGVLRAVSAPAQLRYSRRVTLMCPIDALLYASCNFAKLRAHPPGSEVAHRIVSGRGNQGDSARTSQLCVAARTGPPARLDSTV